MKVPKLFLLIVLAAFDAQSGELKSHIQSFASIKGMGECEFKEIREFSQEILGSSQFSLVYLEDTDKVNYVLLVNNNVKNSCGGLVSDIVKIPSLSETIKKMGNVPRWGIEFKCKYFGEYWGESKPAIGIIDQAVYTEQYLIPIKAWSIDTDSERFMPVNQKFTVCGNFNDAI